jgi:4-aminobutyrate aminotransferase-like enzyme/glycerophosphoryl diester phosphodiesterase
MELRDVVSTEGSTIESPPINIARASGAYLWCVDGKRYFDLFCQTWSVPLGHNHPKIIEAAKRQLDHVTHLRTAFTTNDKLELVNELVTRAPRGLSKVNFTLHGSLAVEGALKLAINRSDDRHKILYLEDGFHGRSFATMGISWKLPDSKYSDYFTHGVEVRKDLRDIESKMLLEKPAALVMELVQGNAGFLILDEEFIHGVAALCRKHDVTLIVDEVQTAFGCTEETFLSSRYGLEPDIIVFGKGIGGGFPLAGLLYDDKLAFAAGEHSFTFGHNPISFAAAVACIRQLDEYAKRVSPLQECISMNLALLQKKYAFVGEVRSIGTKGALDINLETDAASAELATMIVEKMLEAGVIVATSRYKNLGNSILLQASLVTDVAELEAAFATMDRVLSKVAPLRSRRSMLTLGPDEIFANTPAPIVEHSTRHAEIATLLAERLSLPADRVEMLRYASWAHDIGGVIKEVYRDEQRNLLQLEFTSPNAAIFGAKPSFNPTLCIAHAQARVQAGLRTPLTQAEREDPLPLYLEEFASLKGSALSERETELLTTWWLHPLYSLQILENRSIDVPPEIAVLIRCNEQPWLFDSDEEVLQNRAACALTYDELKTLLAVLRVADIVENGNNKYRRDLRKVKLENHETTLAFARHKFSIDNLEDYAYVIDAYDELVREGNSALLDILMRARDGYQTLDADFAPSCLEEPIRTSFLRLENEGSVMNYHYDPTGEFEVLHENLWYKFSFIPTRRGEYDKAVRLDDVISETFDEIHGEHASPTGRKCPFCFPFLDEVVAKVRMPSENAYTFLANIDPYGQEHMIMAAGPDKPQVLNEQYVLDLLTAARGLGHNYEGSFTSVSGASLKHWHGQFYRTKTPVWRNLIEGRTDVVDRQIFDDVETGELSNWPARSAIFRGTDEAAVARQIWIAVSKLMREGVPYNTKFMYNSNGEFIWLLSPRKHGYMTYAGHFLGDQNPDELNVVSGCGSVEAPGGDAIMFFDTPDTITDDLSLAPTRFAKTLRDTSDWSWQLPERNNKFAKILGAGRPHNFRIAHRVESIADVHRAISLGYSMIELDVQMTSDGVLIALWGMISDASDETFKACELTFAEISRITDGNVLACNDICRAVNGEVSLNIDVKDWCDDVPGYQDAVVRRLLQMVKTFNLQRNVLFDSFNPTYIERLRQEAAAEGIEVLLGAMAAKNSSAIELREKIAKAKDAQCSTIFLYPEDLSQDVIEHAHRAGLAVITSQDQLNVHLAESVDLLVVDMETIPDDHLDLTSPSVFEREMVI